MEIQTPLQRWWQWPSKRPGLDGPPSQGPGGVEGCRCTVMAGAPGVSLLGHVLFLGAPHRQGQGWRQQGLEQLALGSLTPSAALGHARAARSVTRLPVGSIYFFPASCHPVKAVCPTPFVTRDGLWVTAARPRSGLWS